VRYLDKLLKHCHRQLECLFKFLCILCSHLEVAALLVWHRYTSCSPESSRLALLGQGVVGVNLLSCVAARNLSRPRSKKSRVAIAHGGVHHCLLVGRLGSGHFFIQLRSVRQLVGYGLIFLGGLVEGHSL